MNKLFILSGASGAGKSTLLDRLVTENYCNAAVKYSQRKRFNTVDDVTSVKNIYDPNLQCDIVYTKYGNIYGFSSSYLHEELKNGNQILITNDKETIVRLKTIFPNQVIVIYIVSDINMRLLRQIYMKRHGFPSLRSIQSHINDQLQTSQSMLYKDNGKEFITCIEKINELIDSILLEDNEFKLRLESIKQQEELYASDFLLYDYVVLNLYSNNTTTIHATKAAFEQLKKIITKETEAK